MPQQTAYIPVSTDDFTRSKYAQLVSSAMFHATNSVSTCTT